MQEIVKVKQENIGGATVQTVKARELHAFLGVGKDFSSWIKERIDQFGFTEGVDFVTTEGLSSPKSVSSKSRPQKVKEYHLALDMAKELSMVERNDKGKQARLYFIECERRAKAPAAESPQLLVARALIAANLLIEEQTNQIECMKPKADFFDAVADSKTALDMALVAKTLNMGIGRNQLFEFLRNEAILDRHNIPYQTYCDRGYFRVVESKYDKPDGTACISLKTVVFQKGMDFIRRRYLEHKEAA